MLSTDGVGTKVLVALQAGRFDTVGEDLVNHSVNDILVHGATPDRVHGLRRRAPGSGVEQIAGIVEGIARGCRAHGMALAGGETAQMPGLYQPGNFDLAGTIIGVVEEDEALHGDRIAPGDVLLAYASTGLHTNGYTLARRIVFERMGLGLDDRLGDTRTTVADVLLAVHRSYFRSVAPVISAGCTGWRTSPAAASRAIWCGYCPRDARRWWIPRAGSCRRCSPRCRMPAGSPPRRCGTSSTSAWVSSPCCPRTPSPPPRRRPRRPGSPPGPWARSARRAGRAVRPP